MIGDTLAPVALAFAVLGLPAGPSALGIVLAAYLVPFAVFLPVGGVLADRHARRGLMIAADVVRASVQAATAAVLLTGAAAIWQLMALQAINGAAAAVFQPALVGVLPEIVDRDQLQRANAATSFATSFSSVLGPMLGGLVVAALSPAWAITVDACTFAVSAVCISRIAIPAHIRRQERFLAAMRDGWCEVRNRNWLALSIGAFSLYQLFAMATLFVLGPVAAQKHFDGATTWAAVITALGIGSIVGDLLTLRFSPRNPVPLVHYVLVAAAPVMLAMALQAPIPIVVIAGGVLGLGLSVSNTLWFTALQTHVPEHSISRVSSYDWLGSSVLRPIGYAVVGPVASLAGVDGTLVVAAIAAALLEIGVATSRPIQSSRLQASPKATQGPLVG